MLNPQATTAATTTALPTLQNDPFTILLADFKRQAANLVYKFAGINVASSLPVRLFGFSLPADRLFDMAWSMLVSKLQQNASIQGFLQAVQQEPKLADAGADMLVSKFSESVNDWKEKLQDYSTKNTKGQNNDDNPKDDKSVDSGSLH